MILATHFKNETSFLTTYIIALKIINKKIYCHEKIYG